MTTADQRKGKAIQSLTAERDRFRRHVKLLREPLELIYLHVQHEPAVLGKPDWPFLSGLIREALDKTA